MVALSGAPPVVSRNSTRHERVAGGSAVAVSSAGTPPAHWPSVPEVEHASRDYIQECVFRSYSIDTIEVRRVLLANLLWFLHHFQCESCGPSELKRFFLYLTMSHTDDSGRWGNPRYVRSPRPETVQNYFVKLRTFFNWMVEDETIDCSPMATLSVAKAPAEQVRPFTHEQVTAILQAAKKSVLPLRNEALVYFLVDTGVRASELCGLRMKDVDMQERRCFVLGKGNKHRYVYFGRNTCRALRHYLRKQHRDENAPLFTSDRGMAAGEALTRSGLRQIIRRLGQAAQLKAVRCSPHTFRHTFAVEFLRAGGNQFSLKDLLGHTSLAMTSKYVALAQADLASQHRRFSPGDRLGRGATKQTFE